MKPFSWVWKKICPFLYFGFGADMTISKIGMKRRAISAFSLQFTVSNIFFIMFYTFYSQMAIFLDWQ